MKPAMKPDELALHRSILSKSRHYLESGCGGTTLLALESDVDKVDIVETDVNWIEKLRSEPAIKAAEEGGRLTFHNADVGEVIDWGIPVDRDKISNWPFFSLGVWNGITPDVDFVFVDGRFRVATTLAALLMTAPGTPVMLHDYVGREHYEAVLDFADVDERVDTALLLRRKPGIAERDIILGWSRFMFDAR